MKSKHQILYTFLNYLKPFQGRLITIFMLVTLMSFGTLASPYILKVIIDEIFPSKNFPALLGILALLVGINVIRIGVQILSDYLHDWVSGRIILDIRKDLFSHILRLPMEFFSDNKKGDVIQRLGHEVDMIERAMTSSAVRFSHNVLTILGLAIALSWLNFQLFVISITVLPFIYWSIKYFQPRIQKAAEKLRAKEGDFTAFMLDRLENIELVKSLNRQSHEVQNLEDKGRSIINASLKETILGSSNGGVTTFLISLTPIIIFSWGGNNVMQEAMTVGALIAFLQYLNRLFTPIRDLMRLYLELIQTKASMKRVFEYLELPVSDTFISEDKPFKFKDSILFNDVSFSYNGTAVIQNLNLKFDKGEKYVIVGKSGSGKSTIVRLLCQYFRPTSGKVLIDEFDTCQIEASRARMTIGYVSQNYQFFNESITSNILYGDLKATQFESQEFARVVGIYEDIMKLPEGFKTNMGDQGMKLSGGQKQLIAIARLLLSNKQILILDEATAALDSIKEEKLWIEILNRCQDKTIIAISHRLSTIRKFDKIICLKDGNIVETGNHHELLSRRSYYYELVKGQLVTESTI